MNKNIVGNKKPNKLLNEKSPYLLQHAYNPINWYSWGDEAFKKAKEEDKPIFLSIGYSTCHWCHVMEDESFEDVEVAKLMNDNFVAIKVDREERPDVDSVYMTVCQGLTGHGGWPLTIIMTPDQKPFFAGTYFPKNTKYNKPGLIHILMTFAERWKDDKKRMVDASISILTELDKYFVNGPNHFPLTLEVLDRGYKDLLKHFDKRFGGFGDAPKFPTPHKVMFLLRYYKTKGEEKALEMAEKTLFSMYEGGLFDHIGFGFCRYSTDRRWLVPHFEKMLYDNALLVLAYLEAYEVTKKDLYKEIAIKTLDYVFRNLTGDEGGFYSAEDADSEGEEGKYYVFTPEEILKFLGEEDGDRFNDFFDITIAGNFEGKNIPNLIKNKNYIENNCRIAELSKRVLEYRSSRMSLHKDDKVLTAWNGLMIAALGKAYKVIGHKKYLDYANNAVSLIYSSLINEDGRLLARYRDGEALYKGYLDDYAFLAFGLIELYEASFDVSYLKKAIYLTEDMIKYFWDKNDGGFFIYGEDGEKLIARPKELFDGAMPSGNSVAAYNLIRLARITGKTELENIAERQLNYMSGGLYGREINHTFYLMAATFALNSSKELVCIVNNKNEISELKDVLRDKVTFRLTALVKTDENKKEIEKLIPSLQDYYMVNNKPTYYLCENHTCQSAVNDIKVVADKIN